MGIKIIFPLCLITIISGADHHPKVYEEQVEHNRHDNIRTARNSEATYKSPSHQPHVFNFGATKQQDYLKHKYAEQQMVDLSRIVTMQLKHRKHIKQPISARNPQFYRSQRTKKDTQDWEPFDPQISTEQVPTSQIFNTTNENASDLATENGGMLSEVMEGKDKINRNDSPGVLSSVIYVHPNMFQQNFGKNVKGTQQTFDVNAKNPDMQLSVLNELIGKNPNVQLEGLMRLLEQPSTENHLPVVKGPQPFQSKDNTPINEKEFDIPNPETMVNTVADGTPEIQIPHIPSVINRESLEDLQKQFDEASKLQIEQVLARANKEAQEQVQAQHKAIALAQAEAQRAALENFENSLYTIANPTAAPLVQHNVQNENNVKPQAMSPSDVSPVTIAPYNTHNQDHSSVEQLPPSLLQGISRGPYGPQVSLHKKLVTLPVNNIVTALSKEVVPKSYSSNKYQHYAPNHQHQEVSQLEDEDGYSPQAQAQNGAILGESSDHQQTFDIKENINERDEAVIYQTTLRPAVINTEFQQEVDPQETRRIKKMYISGEESNYDDPEELQYAARYAFGYRIKDAKEGNDFGHEERRNGKSAEGSYHVLLPDGRLQKVQYYADTTGYHARVTYEQVGH